MEFIHTSNLFPTFNVDRNHSNVNMIIENEFFNALEFDACLKNIWALKDV